MEVVVGCAYENVGKGMERLLVRRLPSNKSGKGELYVRRREAEMHTFTCFSRAATRYLALHVNFATDIHSTESKSGQLS